MISGPIIEPSSGNSPKQMIIFVHGYGADGNDLIGLANYFQSTLPEAIFLSPHAPEACSMNPSGYQWFDLTSTDPAVLWSKILVAADHLNEFIDSKLLEYNIAEENLALIGFSQGTMMSLHVSLRRKNTMAAVLGYSGRLIGADLLKDDLISKPSIYLIHGDQDPMVPYQESLTAEKVLKEYSIDIKTHISEHTQHSIAEDGLRIGVDFLASKLKI
ncbi:MAG: alpha/beta hydrolase [Candidatus Pelagibacterales bacterium]|jgi:phospholipase/carboxylesterase|nr:alpha/beta hydrolase [Pelagibacterales bacterium]MDA9372821.1 alpha/beta hydrolase [Pelagibacterales bacterium]MDB9818038.1 alpha/beta hydrolase [Pelagibacterales bacterium]|tara:strand:+ start:13982 stop:14629 length:648 start_codon:yes stop_codon:yes gene_type:complete